jgi:hypothetical protein
MTLLATVALPMARVADSSPPAPVRVRVAFEGRPGCRGSFSLAGSDARRPVAR